MCFCNFDFFLLSNVLLNLVVLPWVLLCGAHSQIIPEINGRARPMVQWRRIGEKVRMTCKADFPVSWKWPKNSIFQGHIDQRLTKDNENGKRISTLFISSMQSTDTGKYICYKLSDPSINNSYIVFVNPRTLVEQDKLFKRYKPEFQRKINVFLHQDTLVPCIVTVQPGKPSDGLADVSLWMNGTLLNTTGTGVLYNANRGFQISPEVWDDHKMQIDEKVTFYCKAHVMDMIDSIKFDGIVAANVVSSPVNMNPYSISRENVIAMISAAVAIVLALGTCGLLFLLKLRRKKPKPEKLMTLRQLSHIGSSDSTKSQHSEPTSATLMKTFHLEVGKVPLINPSSLTYDRKFELNKDWLWWEPTKPPLGSGHFGKVVSGTLHLPLADAKAYPALACPRKVAIKMANDVHDFSQQRALQDELKIMGIIDHHPNVLGLIGAVTEHMVDGQLFMVMELCELGSLVDYLRNHRKCFLDQTSAIVGEMGPDGYLVPSASKMDLQHSFDVKSENGGELRFASDSLTTTDLVAFSYQLALGMEYLSHILIHRDLAARNCLITECGILKIADFGLAKSDYMYQQPASSETELPYKWLALESIVYNTFSVQSDVWSFGIVLYEIFSLGEYPYLDCAFQQDFIGSLQAGRRMDKPKYATEFEYDLMLKCWKEDPDQRPKFGGLAYATAARLQKCSNTLRDALNAVLTEDTQISREYQNWRRHISHQPTQKHEKLKIQDDVAKATLICDLQFPASPPNTARPTLTAAYTDEDDSAKEMLANKNLEHMKASLTDAYDDTNSTDCEKLADTDLSIESISNEQ